jgi:dolichol-phosphate mannosyltransferase
MSLGVSIVVPCFNEEEGVAQLHTKLTPVMASLRRSRSVELILVDDGSTDRTLEALRSTFGPEPGTRILAHDRNRNLGAALRTGWSDAKLETVAILDADCTYDPEVLFGLVRLVEEGADLALASPYHPQGMVEGVPAWRLLLSRTLSLLYGFCGKPRLYTYTGMVRVFRRASFASFASTTSDFTFVTLMTLWAGRNNLRVAELPAILRTRITGVSKMRTFRVGVRHLRILFALLAGRSP